MRHRCWILTLALLGVTAGAASAQYTTTIGTAPAPTDWWELPGDNAWLGQEFRAPGGATHLRSLTFWLQPSPDWNRDLFTMFSLVRSPHTDRGGGEELDFREPFTGAGRTTVYFPDIPVSPGDLFAFYLETVEGDEWSGELIYPRIEVTRGDTYRGGQMNVMGFYQPGRDIRFEADFTATPEPASMALLATGLAGLAGAARRRRRRNETEEE